MKSGQIVKPLERIGHDSGETSSENGVGHREVVQTANAQLVVSSFDMVFFDVRFGARYRSGINSKP